MKRYLLLLTLSLILNISFGQTISYFDNNPVWRFYNVIGGGCVENGEFNYYLSGDTIIDSYTYKKLFSKGFMDGMDGPGEGCVSYHNEWIDEEPIGFLRQDEKKIYYLKAIYCSEPEMLLYDFDILVNDTVKLYEGIPCGENSPYVRAVVDSIDSVLIDTDYRFLFYITQIDITMSGSVTTEIIEGIGTNKGLLSMVDSEFWLQGLSCFSVNNEQVYPNLGAGFCDIPLNICEEILYDYSNVKIFPNPSTDFFKIVGNRITQIQVIDTKGSIIFDINLINQSEYSIDLSNNLNGIYFVRIITNKETKILKILKKQ